MGAATISAIKNQRSELAAVLQHAKALASSSSGGS